MIILCEPDWTRASDDQISKLAMNYSTQADVSDAVFGEIIPWRSSSEHAEQDQKCIWISVQLWYIFIPTVVL